MFFFTKFARLAKWANLAIKCFLVNKIIKRARFCNTNLFILFIQGDDRLKNVDLKVGDYIMSVNEQNVCRASAKTVTKLIKSSRTLKMTVCRPNEASSSSPMPSAPIESAKKSIKSVRVVAKPEMGLKSLMSCFSRRLVANKVAKRSTVLYDEAKKEDESVLPCMSDDLLSSERANDETIDYGYYSIPTTGSSASSRKHHASSFSTSSSSGIGKSGSVTSLESAVATSIVDLASTKHEIEQFLANMRLVIDTYVRPAAMLKILSAEQSLDLFQNIEKLIPISKFMLSIVNSYEQNPAKLPQADLVSSNSSLT